ncbi:hypothetical protein COO60DRAFT_1628892 [Scenedesmus sp. NREL 46B-D3]|nr:hypothetical protein COO60DRAFT_1628892 [Scenedesmus sp. NREL 46B-D3]
MMRLCCQSRPLCSLVAKPAHAAAAAAARRLGITPRASATCSIATQATGIDPGIVPGTFPPTTPGGGVDPGRVPGIDPAPGPPPPDMPGGIDPRTNPGTPPGPSIIPRRGDPPPGIDTPGLPGPVPGIDPAPGIDPGDLGNIESSMSTSCTGIDPGIVPGTLPPTTPGGGVDPGRVPGIDPAPGPPPPDMPGGIDPRTNPGTPPGPSIIPGRGDPPPGIDTPGLPGPVPGIDPGPGINPGDLGNMSTGTSLLAGLGFWNPQSTAGLNSSSSSSDSPWIMMDRNVPLTVSVPSSLRGYSSSTSNAVGSTPGKPEVDPEAGDPRPDASGPPSGQPGAQPEASGPPSGQPGGLVDAEEPLVGKNRTQGPQEMAEAPSKVSDKPEATNPVLCWLVGVIVADHAVDGKQLKAALRDTQGCHPGTVLLYVAPPPPSSLTFKASARARHQAP